MLDRDMFGRQTTSLPFDKLIGGGGGGDMSPVSVFS